MPDMDAPSRETGHENDERSPADQSESGPIVQWRVNTAGLRSKDLVLKPGRNTVGRGTDNAVHLNHPSVSNRHCEIEVGAEEAVVRDLNSTNGTFIDGERIREGTIRPGQKLCLGEVELEWPCGGVVFRQTDFQLGEPAGVPLAPEMEKPHCACHPQVRAVWVCTECHRPYCAACVKSVALGPRKRVSLCQICQGVCETVEQRRRRAAPVSFGGGLIRALKYPLAPAGLILLTAAMVLSLAFSLAGRSLAFGSASMLLSLGLGVLLLSFLREVVLTSAEGEDSFAPWPELDLERVKQTVILWLAVSLVCFGPWTLCRVAGGLESEAAKWACPVLLGLGAFYFPMALLAVAVQDDVAALNPILVCGSILRTAGKYLVLCLFLAVMAGVTYGVEAAPAPAGLSHPWAAVTGFVSLYAALVMARGIGWFYYCTKEDLGW